MFINIRVLRLRSTDWKSSLRDDQSLGDFLYSSVSTDCLTSYLNRMDNLYVYHSFLGNYKTIDLSFAVIVDSSSLS